MVSISSFLSDGKYIKKRRSRDPRAPGRCFRFAETSPPPAARRRRNPPSRPAKRRRQNPRVPRPDVPARRRERGRIPPPAGGGIRPGRGQGTVGSRFRRPEPAKWPESFFPATLSASPRGIAAAAYAENMPPACFLNAAAAEKIPLREPECATPEARRARSFGVPRRNPAERLRWGEEGQRSGVQKAFSRRAF